MKLIYLAQEIKCVKIVSNSSGKYVQVLSESSIETTQLWMDTLPSCQAYARMYNPSLKLP
ncbi:unnamed protein product [Cuscuta epithymum]|uniref:PH domain-containing protein n=1 Tax=Cuscuta epithymum TaxID=186058 RepID=A0AAV0EDI3_9ASTE|nr:unnamed protein product [Cuscuta epithymum]